MGNQIKESLISEIRMSDPYSEIKASLKIRRSINGLSLSRASRIPFIATLINDIKYPALIITDRDDHAKNYIEELSFWLAEGDSQIFTEPTPLFYEIAEWGQETRINRIRVLSTLSKYHLPYIERPENPPIIVASIRSIMIRTISRREFLKATNRIRQGDKLDIKDLFTKWFHSGYKVVDTVTEQGQIASRGGIMDIWVPMEDSPARLDFFGNQIDNIRIFDPINQRTISSVDEILVTPAREYLTNSLPKTQDITNIESNEFRIPSMHPLNSTILDYFPQESIFIYQDKELINNQSVEIEEAAIKLREENIKEGIIEEDFPIPYKSWSECEDEIEDKLSVNLGTNIFMTNLSDLETPESISINSFFTSCPRFAGRLKPFADYIGSILQNDSHVLIVSRQSQRLQELFHESKQDIGQNKINFIEDSLSEGFIFESKKGISLHLLTDSEIFGWDKPNSRRHSNRLFETPETKYSDLVPGEFVVHVDYGIGLFEGLVDRELDGISKEFLSIQYKSGDQVFVPIHQADRVTPYIGSTGRLPNLGNLGTQEWVETKNKVKGSVQNIAEDLLELYAKRQLAKGFAFQRDTNWQKELESSFPYIETQDQIKVLKEVKRDMEKDRPMDRLLCGDVGYGKTEIALRAAFKAVMDGKQVAVLVPTTILAQQHFDTFYQRLSPFPVSVEMLSRFRNLKEQEKILKQLSDGKIDIIIGTHRIVQKDVNFKDLGLLIIDEEQRFGVTHKEYIKKLRTEIDVLTLTATPIPRTLYMALTGIRDISQLNTPPEERMPVVTHIGPYSQKIVRHAICRELERGGQVFFVHNRVQTIQAMKQHINNLVPEARVGIGHGQMPEQQLSEVMRNFTRGEIDVLLCTSIIESGLDIPNANTLIVDRGDTFGLAQLYQLRGRVGRGASRAYAYFFRHRKKLPTLDGQERLETIAENSQLGSGYSIAMRDLEMRGAGDLLGSRQHGYIAAVGFHLYTRLLASAVKNSRKSIGLSLSVDEDNLFKELSLPVNVDLPLDTSIPSNYIDNKELRLKLYRRIAAINNSSEMEELKAEFTDRFGTPPQPVLNLFYLIRLKIKARNAGITSISFDNRQLIIRFPSIHEYASQEEDMKDINKSYPVVKKDGIRTGKNAYWMLIDDTQSWKEKLVDLLDFLSKDIK